MYSNSKLLHGVRSKRDVTNLPPHRRERLLIAVKGAETLLGMALRSQQYRDSFKFGQSNVYCFDPTSLYSTWPSKLNR